MGRNLRHAASRERFLYQQGMERFHRDDRLYTSVEP
jgi:hypothetical protein